MKGSHTLEKEQADNLGGGPPDCGTVIMAEAGGHALAGQTSHQKTPRMAKEGEGTHKRMRMIEVEKLKKDLEDPKKQRVLQGSKEKVEKVADLNNKGGNDTQQNIKGKRKRTKKTTTTEKNTKNDSNVNATVGEHVSAISLGEVQKYLRVAIQPHLTHVLCFCGRLYRKLRSSRRMTL